MPTAVHVAPPPPPTRAMLRRVLARSAAGPFLLLAALGAVLGWRESSPLALGLSLAVGALLAAVTARRVGHTVSTYARALHELGAHAVALGEREERYRLLVDAVQDVALCALDPQGRVAAWSAGAERLMGWPADEVVGKPGAVLLPPGEDPGALERQLAAARDAGRQEVEARWRRRDGSTLRARVAVSPLRDARGVLLGYAAVARPA